MKVLKQETFGLRPSAELIPRCEKTGRVGGEIALEEVVICDMWNLRETPAMRMTEVAPPGPMMRCNFG